MDTYILLGGVLINTYVHVVELKINVFLSRYWKTIQKVYGIKIILKVMGHSNNT